MSNKFYTNYATIGNTLHMRGYDNGKYFHDKIPVTPTLYVEDLTGQSPIKSIFDVPLKPVSIESAYDARKFLDSYRGTNMTVCGNTNWGSQHIIENPKLSEYNQDDIKLMFFDIEVYSANIGGKFPEPSEAQSPIVSISAYDYKEDQYYVLGYPLKKGEQVWDRTKSVLHEEIEDAQEILDNIKYFECDNELDLMNKFLFMLNKLKPDILSGWNSDSFDLVYIFNRLQNLGIKPQRLSPWGKCTIREFQGKYSVDYSVNISGISNIDYLALYTKREEPQPSYKLDYIAKKELDQNKIAYEGSLNNLYETNYQKFIDYNIVDTVLLNRMERKKRLFDSVYGEAYRTKSTFDDTFGTVKKWENLIADELWQVNKMPPAQRPEKYEGARIPGGFVKDPDPNRYGWAMSFDYNSLYPNLIMQYNISMETLVESYGQVMTSVDMMLNKETDTSFLKENECLCPSGYVYRTDEEGILPRLMRVLYEERVVMKKKMIEARQRAAAGDKEAEAEAKYYDIRQNTAKILLNSGYGALAANSFLYFDNRLASSITLSGQLSIKWAEKAMNKYFNTLCKTEGQDFCLAIDTDSLYMNIDPLVEKFCKDMPTEKIVDAMDKFADEKIEKELEQTLEELKDYTQAMHQKMVAKRENIASAAIWTRKKRYCMLVHDSEKVRYPEPKLKITGLEAIRSSTPDFAREHMMNLIKLIMTSDEATCQEYMKKVKDEYDTTHLTNIAFPKSMNGMSKYKDLSEPKWSIKGCPAQAHGAIVYNEMIERLNLVNQQKIKEGTKAYFVYMKKPNAANNTHVLSFESEIPKEFGVDDAVDRNAQFEKSFLKPMEPLFKLSGWETEKKATLDALFS